MSASGERVAAAFGGRTTAQKAERQFQSSEFDGQSQRAQCMYIQPIENIHITEVRRGVVEVGGVVVRAGPHPIPDNAHPQAVITHPGHNYTL